MRGYLPKVHNCFFTILFKINRAILDSLFESIGFANQSVEMLNLINLKDQTLFLDIEKTATIHLRFQDYQLPSKEQRALAIILLNGSLSPRFQSVNDPSNTMVVER
ncbi:hypothetical protein C5167_016492 [Papaver somniferum]|nr:hypothetical protein C5167_016492 [Papaver somniferum]